MAAMGEGGDWGGAARDEDERFPPNAIHLIRTTQTIHVSLSQMADQKASILMGAALVIFTIAIGQARAGPLSPSLLILGGGALAAAVCAMLAVLPATARRGGPANLLFFGSFARIEQEDYVERLIETLRREPAIYRAMARDLHQNGVVLARKKYRLLGYAYRALLAGLIASALAFALEQIARAA